MENDREEKPEIDCSMSFSLVDKEQKNVAAGECKATIDKEYLTVFPEFGNILPFHLRDITQIIRDDYRVILPLVSAEKITLSNLGLCFEDFLRILTNLRNEVIIKDLLMNEQIKKTDVEMEFAYFDDAGNEKTEGAGKIRLYETGLVVIPQKSEVFRIPYSDIAKVSKENLRIDIDMESGERIALSKMGSEFDSFLRTLSEVNNALELKATSSLKTLFPGIDSLSLRKTANLMKEGKAATRTDIESIDPKLWQQLEKKIYSSGLNEPYIFLKTIARPQKICVGFKRGLLGDLSGEYLWFLIPIYDVDTKDYGNAVAMEAAGEENGGRATYFFRITSRKDYRNYRRLEELDNEIDEFIRKINRCMYDINFRREPIYFSEEKLDEPDYLKYKIAIQRIPSLRLLRNLYIGRVIHAFQQQWESDVMDLLRFNLAAQDDSAKWKRQKQ